MKVTELKKLYEQHTKDGVVDYESINETINTQFNDIIKKNVESEKASAINDYVKGLGIENVENDEQFKSYIGTLKSTATEKDSKLAEVLKTQKELETQKAEFEQKYTQLATEKTTLERKDLLRSKGIKNDYVEEALVIAGSKVTEDTPFDKVLDDMMANEKYNIFTEGSTQANFSSRTGGQQDKTADQIMADLRKQSF